MAACDPDVVSSARTATIVAVHSTIALHRLNGAITVRDMIKVAIVDDNRLVREALAAMLDRIPDLQRSSRRAPTMPRSSTQAQPDVLLLDAGLRDEDSLRVAAALAKRATGTKIIMMDLMPTNEDIVQFVNAGVAGFVLKDATFDEFVATIRTVAAGDKVLPPRMTESLFSQIAQAARRPAPRARHRGRAHDAARTRGDRADRRGIEQQGNRPAAQHRGAYGQESRAQRHGEARAAHATADRRVLAARRRARSARPRSSRWQPHRRASGVRRVHPFVRWLGGDR